MAEQIPATYKAQLLNGFSQPFEFGTIPIPELKDNELLIKVKASPINPHDQGFIPGFLEQPQNPSILPITAGCEGSGRVVNIGLKGYVFHELQNQAYGKYAVTTENFVILLDDDLSFEESASTKGNPLTVIAMNNVAKEGCKAVVSSAAASQLGKQLQRYFTRRGIAVINIVRRQEQVKILKSGGAQYILNETELNFIVELKELSLKLNVSIFFDPVGGDSTGNIQLLCHKRQLHICKVIYLANHLVMFQYTTQLGLIRQQNDSHCLIGIHQIRVNSKNQLFRKNSIEI